MTAAIHATKIAIGATIRAVLADSEPCGSRMRIAIDAMKLKNTSNRSVTRVMSCSILWVFVLCIVVDMLRYPPATCQGLTGSGHPALVRPAAGSMDSRP